MKRKLIQVSAFIMAFILFISYPLSVYASEKWEGSLGLTIYYNLAEVKQYIKDTAGFWNYVASQAGAIFKSNDWKQFMENYEKMDELLDGKVGLYKENENSSAKGVFLSKEFMAQLKSLIDEYAKQTEPYRIVQISSYKDLDPANYTNKGQYNTICNLAKEHGLISVNKRYIANLSEVLVGGYAFVLYYEDGIYTESLIYDSDWNFKDFPFKQYPYGNEPLVYTTFDQLDEPINMNVKVHNKFPMNDILLNGKAIDRSSTISDVLYGSLISKNGGRYRVYNTLDDYKRYSVGKRNVYYTKNYYNYEPDDLKVPIEDLQKTIDELQKVIDELRKQLEDMGNDTSESEIEDLLRQILDAIKNQQGSGGGDGEGGGDVIVDIDLTTTNSLLERIYAQLRSLWDDVHEQLTQLNENFKKFFIFDDAPGINAKYIASLLERIYEKILSSTGQSMDEVVESIENLQKMLKKYLSEITGDLDDIKEKLEDISENEFKDKTDDFLDDTTASFSEIAEVAKNKFPLSIPYDLKNLFAVISPKPAEASETALYSDDQALYSVQSTVVYEGNGKAISVREGSDDAKVGMSSTGAPVFNLPIVVKSVGWDYTIIADMSQFQTVADLSRTMFTLIFILGIIKLSIAVIGLWGDIVD